MITMDPIDLTIPPSLDSENFRATWAEWVEFRMSLKKVKRWDILFRKQLEWLSCMSVPTAIAVLDQSMRGGWVGLFDVKTPQRGYQGSNQAIPTPSIHTLQEQLKLVEKELKDIENGASWDAFGPSYSDEERAARRPLLEKRKELKRQLGIG